MKATQYWMLWDEFTRCLIHVPKLDAMALLELPNGCDYWKDDGMVELLEGANVFNHRFDGCMYGLRSRFHPEHCRLKKPWRIVSWGVAFPALRITCDGMHEHGKCEGRETKVTQEYTLSIIKTIVNRVNREASRRMTGVGKVCSPYCMSDQEKEAHSLFSESPRSPSHEDRERLLRNPDIMWMG